MSFPEENKREQPGQQLRRRTDLTSVTPDAFGIGSLATHLCHVYSSALGQVPEAQHTTSWPREPSHLEQGCGLCVMPGLDKLRSPNNRVSCGF